MPQMTAYPSPVEREAIIAERLELAETLSNLQATLTDADYETAINTLAEEHGRETIERILQKVVNPSYYETLLGGEAILYREYRRTYARFGGERPFLNKAEFEEATFTYTKVVAKRLVRSIIPFLSKKRSQREKELYERLLTQVAYWEDITPPDPPSKPASFTQPPRGAYDAPLAQLLTWGWLEDNEEVANKIENLPSWKIYAPQLREMVLDEGLLAGWPGDEASWASFHALTLLGLLQAHEQAMHLLALLDRDDDWLSDRVPLVWGQMGPEAEAPLWTYLDKRAHEARKRGYVLLGLSNIAINFPARRDEIIDKMAELLKIGPPQDETGNGYLVYVLNQLNASQTKPIILDAFKQNKVDPAIMQVGDVAFLKQSDKLGNRPWRQGS